MLTALQSLTGITANQLVAPLFLAAGGLLVLMVVLLVVVLKRINHALEQQSVRARELEQQEDPA